MNDPIHRNSSCLEFLMRFMDILVIETAGIVAAFIHFDTPLNEQAPIHSILLHLCAILSVLIFGELDLYGSWRGRSLLEMFVRLAAAWGLVVLIGLFFSFLIHYVGLVSRPWLFYWYGFALSILVMYRIFAYLALRRLRARGLNTKRVIIVGYGNTGQEMHRRALYQDWVGYEVKAVHADVKGMENISDLHVDRINALEDIHDYVEKNEIQEIWITLPLTASPKLLELQHILRNALVDIRWMPDVLGLQTLSKKVSYFMGFPAVDLNQPNTYGANGFMKNAFDKAFATSALILLLPLLLTIAICIKTTSPGPVFFRQPRLGLNGKKFNVFKFRTMKVHGEDEKVTQATQNDPRLTSIGGFLRRTSLDELPQFLNVLFGEMSVVGPRPHALPHNQQYKDVLELYMVRHRVKPGITGWAQIHGYRGETDTIDKMAKRVQFDLQYIQNWSFWMDVRIIAWTAVKGWTGNNAY